MQMDNHSDLNTKLIVPVCTLFFDMQVSELSLDRFLLNFNFGLMLNDTDYLDMLLFSGFWSDKGDLTFNQLVSRHIKWTNILGKNILYV